MLCEDPAVRVWKVSDSMASFVGAPPTMKYAHLVRGVSFSARVKASSTAVPALVEVPDEGDSWCVVAGNGTDERVLRP